MLAHRCPRAHDVKEMRWSGLGVGLLTSRVMGTLGDGGIGLLDAEIHTAILRCTHDEVALHLSTQRQKGDHIPVAVTHMDPLHPRRRDTTGLHAPFPHLRLPLALFALALGFSFGNWMPQKRFLMRQAQHLPILGPHGQHAL